MRITFYLIMSLVFFGCGTMDYEERPVKLERVEETSAHKAKVAELEAVEAERKRTQLLDDSDSTEQRRGRAIEKSELVVDATKEVFSPLDVLHIQLQYEQLLDRQKSVLENRMLMLGLITGGILGAAYFLFDYQRFLKQHKTKPTRRALKSAAIGGACGLTLAILGVKGPQHISDPPNRPALVQTQPTAKDDKGQVNLDKVRSGTRNILFPGR